MCSILSERDGRACQGRTGDACQERWNVTRLRVHEMSRRHGECRAPAAQSLSVGDGHPRRRPISRLRRVRISGRTPGPVVPRWTWRPARTRSIRSGRHQTRASDRGHRPAGVRPVDSTPGRSMSTGSTVGLPWQSNWNSLTLPSWVAPLGGAYALAMASVHSERVDAVVTCCTLTDMSWPEGRAMMTGPSGIGGAVAGVWNVPTGS